MVLVLLAGMWLLCLSLLSLAVISQRSSRIRLEGLQAELAVHAGLEHLRADLSELCRDENFLVIGDDADSPGVADRLYLVRPEVEGVQVRYRHHPLYSSTAEFEPRPALRAPESGAPVGATTHLQIQPARMSPSVQWLPVHDAQQRMVARYAYWVEDLEGRLDPSLVGLEHEGPIRLQAMDASPDHVRARHLLQRRWMMRSPESALAAAGIGSPLRRTAEGSLVDSWADFLEKHTIIGLQSYEEQPLVPYARGLATAVMGQPKRNLNLLLNQPPHSAVEEMAGWIRLGLPRFEERQGGFPENYLETLAANAIDYADRDTEPVIIAGRCRGIDGQPFLSEVVLHLHFQGLVREGDRWVLKWTLRLFAELWNMGSEPIESGRARLSYEVNLRPTAVGIGEPATAFDDPGLLDDSQQCSHQLVRVNNRYFTPEIEVSLRPDEYRFYEFATLDYSIDCAPQFDESGRPLVEWFDLVEAEDEARGLSLVWNGREVERLQRILRDPHGLANFRTDRRRKTAKACIAALNYGGYASMINNPGDPRMSHYLSAMPLGENAYPDNLSPHRRNIRRHNIYDRDPSPAKTRHYGRVMPSQWPDGGHDSSTGDFRVTTSVARFPTDPGLWPLESVPTPQASQAPQRLSNRGCFRKVTELGRIHDPLMWTPAYPDLRGQAGSGSYDTAELTGLLSIWQRPAMPLRRGRWPEVSWSSVASGTHGGGNTLRIGRPEHRRFDEPGMRASHLLDLFHCGQEGFDDALSQQAATIRVRGRVNINTASHEVLSCLAYGALREDEALARIVNHEHDIHHALGPQVEPWHFDQEQLQRVAERIAGGIIHARPLTSTSALAHVRDRRGDAVFGNAALHENGEALQWSDAAAEEMFARVHAAGGVRSRNFRVWIVGQSLQGHGERLRVTAQACRVMTLFVDPGERGRDGKLNPNNQKVRVLHERSF